MTGVGCPPPGALCVTRQSGACLSGVRGVATGDISSTFRSGQRKHLSVLRAVDIIVNIIDVIIEVKYINFYRETFKKQEPRYLATDSASDNDLQFLI